MATSFAKITVAIGMLALAAGRVPAEEAQLRESLREYDAAKAAFEKEAGKFRNEDLAKLKKAGKDAFGEAITEYLPALQRAVFWLGGAKRSDAEKALRAHDMEAMKKEIEELKHKVFALWTDKSEWFTVPFNLIWESLAGEAPGLVEYMILQPINAEYPSVSKDTRAGMLRWIAAHHQSLGLDYFGSRQVQSLAYKADEDRVSAYTMPDNTLAFWFYVRSPSPQPAKIAIDITSKGDEIDTVYVNQDSKGAKGNIKAKLRKGANLIIILVRNFQEQECALKIKLKGEGLESGKRWPHG